MSTRGIIILALGHSNYGELAANLAASLRGGGIHITLYYHGEGISTLTADKLKLFDKVEPLDEKHITKNGRLCYLRAKACLYDITPYHETMFFDADTLWFGNQKRTSNLFTELAKVCDFTMTNNGCIDLANNVVSNNFVRWASTVDIMNGYKLEEGKLFSLNSEFIYFKNTKENEKYFKTVKQIFDKPKINVKEFAGDIPDEIAYCIASILCNVYPHESPYRLLYWQPLDKNKSLQQVMKQHGGYSVGGNFVSEQMKNQYNILAGMYNTEAAINNTWQIVHKKRYLKERELL